MLGTENLCNRNNIQCLSKMNFIFSLYLLQLKSNGL